MRIVGRVVIWLCLISILAVCSASALSSDDWMEKGRQYLVAEDTAAAISCLNQSLKLNAKNAGAYYFRGIAYEGLKKDDSALLDLNNAIKFAPKDWRPYIERHGVLFRKGDYKGAEADITKAISCGAKNPLAYAMRGEIRCMVNNYSGALEDYAKAVKMDPENPNLYILRSNIYEDLKKSDLQIADLTKAIALRPKEADIYLKRAHAYMVAVFYGKATKDVDKALTLKPDDPLAWWDKCVLTEFWSKSNEEKAKVWRQYLKYVGSSNIGNPEQARRRLAQLESNTDDESHETYYVTE